MRGALSFLVEWIANLFAKAVKAVLDGIASLMTSIVEGFVRMVIDITQGRELDDFQRGLLLVPLIAMMWDPIRRIQYTFTAIESTEIALSAILSSTGIGAGVKPILSKITMDSIKKTLTKILIGMTIGVIVKNVAGLADRKATENWATKFWENTAALVAVFLALIDLLDELETKNEAPRSKYASAVGLALVALILEIIGVPFLFATLSGLGLDRGTPLAILDAVALALTVPALVILLGNHWVRLGESKLMDTLVEWLGPISSGIEEVLTSAGATSVFFNVGIHIANNDY